MTVFRLKINQLELKKGGRRFECSDEDVGSFLLEEDNFAEDRCSIIDFSKTTPYKLLL